MNLNTLKLFFNIFILTLIIENIFINSFQIKEKYAKAFYPFTDNNYLFLVTENGIRIYDSNLETIVKSYDFPSDDRKITSTYEAQNTAIANFADDDNAASTPAWPPPRACNSDGTLQGPPPSQATRCPLETTSTLRRVHSASSMCRIFSPCTDLPLAPHTPFPASLCPSPSPRSLQLSNSQPRHHVSQPAPPSTQHRFTPSVQSQVCYHLLKCPWRFVINIRQNLVNELSLFLTTQSRRA